jgi:hypothetical protein
VGVLGLSHLQYVLLQLSKQLVSAHSINGSEYSLYDGLLKVIF